VGATVAAVRVSPRTVATGSARVRDHLRGATSGGRWSQPWRTSA
jgi:hypothetical protein